MIKQITQITQEEQDSFFKVGDEMWSKAKKVYELVDDFYQNETDEQADETLGLSELSDLAKEIKELKSQKEKLTRTAIGYMYNGVLVSGEISCRRGEVYRFRCQYRLSNKQIKSSILKGLQEVEKKITSHNLEILETLLATIDEDDKDSYSGYYSTNRGERVEEKLEQPIRIAEFDKDNGVGFKEIQKILINENGDINFENEDESTIRLEDYSLYMLKAKLKNKLLSLSKNFIEKQTTKRDFLITEIKTIKSKASNLLMLAEIDKQDDNK